MPVGSCLHWSPRWPCDKLSCNKGLCASGCFFVVTTSFSLAGLYSLALKVLAGCCGFWWLCFVVVLVCVCFGFRTCSVSPLVLRPTRTAYCAADVVKRRRFKKNRTCSSFQAASNFVAHPPIPGACSGCELQLVCVWQLVTYSCSLFTQLHVSRTSAKIRDRCICFCQSCSRHVPPGSAAGLPLWPVHPLGPQSRH